MVKKIEVHNFQNLTIDNATITNHPLTQAKEVKKDLLSVVIVRDPYVYFDTLLYDYLLHKRSLLYTDDIIKQMKKLDNNAFFQWFETLNFIPFYNPQTFQLDTCKRSSIAIEHLESFDYVVPYEEIDIFLKNISSDITIEMGKEVKLRFSLSTQKNNELSEKFIGKDLELYKRSLELWELIKKNNFKPLSSLINRKKPHVKQQKINKYKGVVGQITSNSIAGWVYHEEKQSNMVISIYINGIFLRMLKADIMREDLKKQQIHPTGQCGFEALFDEPTFKKGDKIEVKVLPDKTILPLGKNVKKFLEME